MSSAIQGMASPAWHVDAVQPSRIQSQVVTTRGCKASRDSYSRSAGYGANTIYCPYKFCTHQPGSPSHDPPCSRSLRMVHANLIRWWQHWCSIISKNTDSINYKDLDVALTWLVFIWAHGDHTDNTDIKMHTLINITSFKQTTYIPGSTRKHQNTNISQKQFCMHSDILHALQGKNIYTK